MTMFHVLFRLNMFFLSEVRFIEIKFGMNWSNSLVIEENSLAV